MSSFDFLEELEPRCESEAIFRPPLEQSALGVLCFGVACDDCGVLSEASSPSPLGSFVCSGGAGSLSLGRSGASPRRRATLTGEPAVHGEAVIIICRAWLCTLRHEETVYAPARVRRRQASRPKVQLGCGFIFQTKTKTAFGDPRSPPRLKPPTCTTTTTTTTTTTIKTRPQEA